MQRHWTPAVLWRSEERDRDRRVAKMAKLILSEFSDVSKEAAHALLNSASIGPFGFQRRTNSLGTRMRARMNGAAHSE